MSFLDRVDSIARRVERFVAGSTPSDPLYISNRTLGQKIRLGLLIGTPVLAIAAFVALALNNYFNAQPAQRATAPKAPTGEITAKVLPNLEKEYRSDSDRRIDVTEAFVAQ